MKTQAAFLTLIEELNGDMSELDRLAEINARAWRRIQSGAVDVLDYGALAFTIHTIYGLLENYFLRISKFFENSLPSDTWHRTLVDRMALNIPGVRPALIADDDLKKRILELLRFRHRFRNLYGEDLAPDKTAAVQSTLARVVETLPNVHDEFRTKLLKIADAL